jgi:hypothetical protein
MALEKIVLRCVGRIPPTSQRMVQRILMTFDETEH